MAEVLGSRHSVYSFHLDCHSFGWNLSLYCLCLNTKLKTKKARLKQTSIQNSLIFRAFIFSQNKNPDWHHKTYTWFHTYSCKLMLILSQLLHSAFFQQRRICQIGFRANKANSQKNSDSINFPWSLISCLIQLFAHYCCCPKSLYVSPVVRSYNNR